MRVVIEGGREESEGGESEREECVKGEESRGGGTRKKEMRSKLELSRN